MKGSIITNNHQPPEVLNTIRGAIESDSDFFLTLKFVKDNMGSYCIISLMFDPVFDIFSLISFELFCFWFWYCLGFSYWSIGVEG